MLVALRKWLFSRKLTELGGFLGGCVRFLRVLWFAARKFRLDHCFERAGTLSFATIISLIPSTVLALGIAVAFGLGDTFIAYAKEQVFPQLAPAFQTQLSDWLENNLSKHAFSELGTARLGGLVVIVSLAMTALGGLIAAERNFNKIWQVESTRSYLQKAQSFWVVITVSPLVLLATIWVKDLLAPKGGMVDTLTREHVVLEALYGFVVPVTVALCGFTILFRFLPAAPVRMASACVGGVVSAVLWEISKQVFVVYWWRSKSVTSLYGSLAVVPLFLVWVYLNWLIALLGCQVAYAHQHLEVLSDYLDQKDVRFRPSLSFVAICLLERVGRAFVEAVEPPSTDDLGRDLLIEETEIEEAARRLVEAGILAEDARNPGIHHLAKAPEAVNLEGILRIFPSGDSWLAERCPSAGISKCPGLITAAHERLAGAFEGKTLASLLDAPAERAAGVAGPVDSG